MIRAVTEGGFPVLSQVVVCYDDHGYLPMLLFYPSRKFESRLPGESDVNKDQLRQAGLDDPKTLRCVAGLLDPYRGKA